VYTHTGGLGNCLPRRAYIRGMLDGRGNGPGHGPPGCPPHNRTSLREALSALLGGPCFHMIEYEWHPELMAPPEYMVYEKRCKW
jgi:hypothetical protein